MRRSIFFRERCESAAPLAALECSSSRNGEEGSSTVEGHRSLVLGIASIFMFLCVVCAISAWGQAVATGTVVGTVTDNTGGGGIIYEVSLTSALFRNNISLRNGADLTTETGPTADVGSYASAGVQTYCNVLQIQNVAHTHGLLVVGSNRGYNPYSPYEYLTSTGNAFHHNTVFWTPGATGLVGYFLNDTTNQPDFFSENEAPDYNMYHLPSLSQTVFVYDNNSSGQNTLKSFAQYQAAGADIHGSADTKYGSSYPAVKITAPLNNSTVATSATITAAASDATGIAKVEFFVDWSLQSTVTSSPYTFDWTNAATGAHTITAMAYNKNGIGVCYAITLNKL